MKKGICVCPIICILLIAVFGSGCIPQVRTDHKPSLREEGELYCYLQPLPQEMLPLAFIISDVSVIAEQGNTIPLIEEELQITGRELVNIQKRLFSKTLPPGRYTSVSLTISEATIATEEGNVNLLPPDQPLRLDLDFSILRGESLALFLDLSPEYLVTDRFKFTPRFVLAKPYLRPKNYLGFISNSRENIVSVFNKRTMEIVQVIRVGVAPKGMALDQNRGIVYVALAGEDAIALISVDSLGLLGRIKLRFGDEPVEVALSPDGETLIAANYGSGTVSIIDTSSRSEVERLSQEPDPVWVVADRDGRQAYVLHSLSNTVSIIDLPNRRLRTSFSLDESPLRGAVNRDGSRLYIVSRYSTDLQIIDTSSRRIIDTVFIGSNASSIITDPKNDLVYVGKTTGEVMVVDPGSGIFIDSFQVQGDVGFMAIDGEENRFLVLSAVWNTVHKFNLVSKRDLASVTSEEGAHAVVVMGELL